MFIAPRILIIEDDPLQRDLFAQIVTRYFPTARLTTVATGADGVAAYHAHGTDLLILDHRLPDILGGVWLHSLRQRGVETPAILVAGMLPREEVSRHPHTYVLSKPMALAALLATMRQALAADGTPRAANDAPARARSRPGSSLWQGWFKAFPHGHPPSQQEPV